ncbi:hypothetical protein GXW84_29615 [Rhodococcus sp. IEGM 248]|nr:hypothetical protein [Rhodococcus sp. IEGM 248]
MTGSWIPEDPFDDIFNRFFGSGGRPRPQVQRVDLGRLLNDDAKQLVSLARQAAQDWGNSAITLSPAAKLALRTAQQQASQAGVSYIGPKHILLGIASNPDSPAASALSGAKIDAGKGPHAKSSTPTLDEYGRDLTAEAGGGNIDPVVGRSDEIAQIQKQLDNKLSSILLKGVLSHGDTVRVDANGAGLSIGVGSAAGDGSTPPAEV